VVNGKPKRIRVCTRCISAGKVTKPVVKVKQTV
jgi:ribosomal protein L28